MPAAAATPRIKGAAVMESLEGLGADGGAEARLAARPRGRCYYRWRRYRRRWRGRSNFSNNGGWGFYRRRNDGRARGPRALLPAAR